MASAITGPVLKTGNYGLNPFTSAVFKTTVGANGLTVTPSTPPHPLMSTRNFGVDMVAKKAYTSHPGSQALVQVGGTTP